MKLRSFVFDHLLAVLAAIALMSIYGWLVWNWSETQKELNEYQTTIRKDVKSFDSLQAEYTIVQEQLVRQLVIADQSCDWLREQMCRAIQAGIWLDSSWRESSPDGAHHETLQIRALDELEFQGDWCNDYGDFWGEQMDRIVFDYGWK